MGSGGSKPLGTEGRLDTWPEKTSWSRTLSAFSASKTNGRPLPAAGGVPLAEAADTGGLFTLIHTTVPPQDSVPLHRHAAMNESFYVINGAIAVTVGIETHEVGSGGFAFLPRAVPHRHVAGANGAEMLIHSSPGGLERFLMIGRSA